MTCDQTTLQVCQGQVGTGELSCSMDTFNQSLDLLPVTLQRSLFEVRPRDLGEFGTHFKNEEYVGSDRDLGERTFRPMPELSSAQKLHP